MVGHWYCRIGEKEYGPMPDDQLRQLVKRGQLKQDSMVRQGRQGGWHSAAEVKGLFTSTAASDIPTAVATAQAPRPPRRPSSAAATPAASPPPRSGAEPQVSISVHDSRVDQLVEEETKISGGVIAGVLGLAGVVIVGLVIAIAIVIGGGDEESVALPSDAAPKQADAAPVTPVVDAGRDRPQLDVALRKKIALVKSWLRSTQGVTLKRGRDAVVQIQVGEIWRGNEYESDPVANDVVAGSASDPVLDVRALGVKGESPAGNVEADATQITTATDNSSAQDATKYLFVSMKVTNRMKENVLEYAGWNGDGELARPADAFLVDNSGRAFPIVSRLEVPGDARLLDAAIDPGQEATDLLVFELPDTEFEHLKLVLPKSAVGLSGMLGYQLDPAELRPRARLGVSPVTIAVQPSATPRDKSDAAASTQGDVDSQAEKDDGEKMEQKPAEEQVGKAKPKSMPSGEDAFKALQRSINQGMKDK